MSDTVVWIGRFALLLEAIATAQIVLLGANRGAMFALGLGLGASLTAYISERANDE
jgi:hypothetical protein